MTRRKGEGDGKLGVAVPMRLCFDDGVEPQSSGNFRRCLITKACSHYESVHTPDLIMYTRNICVHQRYVYTKS